MHACRGLAAEDNLGDILGIGRRLMFLVLVRKAYRISARITLTARRPLRWIVHIFTVEGRIKHRTT